MHAVSAPFPLNMSDADFQRLEDLRKWRWLHDNPGSRQPGEMESIEAKYPDFFIVILNGKQHRCIPAR